MAHTSPRLQAILRMAPAVVLLGLVAFGGAYALTHRHGGFSDLDGARLATLTRPTVGSVSDKTWMTAVDTFADERMPMRTELLESHAAFVSKVLRDPIVNRVYTRGPHGQLLEQQQKLTMRETLADEANALAALEPDAPTLFVYAPRKEEIYSAGLPDAWSNPYPEAKAQIFDAWSAAGTVVDATGIVASHAENYTAYFRTDHHWRAGPSRDVVDAIADSLALQGVVIGTDSRQYETVVASEPFYGSTGRRVTAGATEPDVFTYDQPVGGFRATMCIDDECGLPTIDVDAMNLPSKYANRYRVFIGGDNGLVTITNPDPAAKGSLLLLKDSFGNSVATYLAERVKTLYVVDERHYTGVPLDLLVQQQHFDAVISLHNALTYLTSVFRPEVWTERADVTSVEPQVFDRSAIVTSDGLIVQGGPHQLLDDSLADDATTLAGVMTAIEVPQFWYYAPRKEQVFADLFPVGMANPVAANGPPALALLRKAHPVTDLTPLLDVPSERDENYFLTDHHWTIRGASLAADAVAADLVAAGVNLGTDRRAWHRVDGPLPFYGTELATVPPGTTVVPDTYWYEEPDGGFRSRICDDATCSTPVIATQYLTHPEKLTNRYRAVLGEARPQVHLHNDDPAAAGTIVMLTDSYGLPVALKLAERASDVYIVDERKWDGGPVGKFVTDVDADAVVFLHNHVSVLSLDFNMDVWRTAGH